MNFKTYLYRALLTGFLLTLSHALFAGTTGKIMGIISDGQTGDPLVGVNVLVEGTELGASTNMKGRYTIMNVPPGIYTLRATMMGYAEVRVTQVDVTTDLTTTIDIVMSEEALEGEEVVVVAERPMVRKDVMTTTSSVSSQELDAMPVEEFEDVLETQAGVVKGAGGALHVRGGRSDEVRYLVDGVPVTDPFNSSMAVEIENNAIEELQMVSGTFNAEYGQAMSGVVNIVTRSGNLERYKGTVRFYGGDYISTDTELFHNIDAINPLAIRDLQVNFEGPVPLMRSRASFFLSLRNNYDEGYLYGIRKYLPGSWVMGGSSPESISGWSPNRDEEGDKILGDSTSVPMEWSNQLSFHGKLMYNITPKIKLTLNGTRSGTEYQNYTHKFRLNPEGDYHHFRDNTSLIARLNHTLSPETFYTVSYSYFMNDVSYYAQSLEDSAEFHETYSVDPRVFGALGGGYNFYPGGVGMQHYYRTTNSQNIKADLNTQLSARHEIKTGVEFNIDLIDYESFEILYNQNVNWVPTVPEYNPDDPATEQYRSTPLFDSYEKQPQNFAAYIQDKIEFDFIVLNVGLRFERFVPDGKVLSDPNDPNYLQPIKPEHRFHDENDNGIQDPGEADMTDEERLEFWFKDAEPKYQFSPRLGVAYPITDRGVIHFSYGHFLQIPSYQYLYTNPDFEVTTGISSTIGNANLEPQRTVQYEVGLQQQLTDNLAVYATGFYKDIRNLLGTRIIDTAIAGNRYALYINRDYGNVRGFTFALQQRSAGILSGRIDYTFSVAEGNASDPASTYYDEIAGREPEKQLVYLDWDQRHTLNGSLTLNPGHDIGISIMGQFGSGLPYTPSSLAGDRVAFENSDRKPARTNVDLRAHKRFQITETIRLTLLASVYNLFDRRNERYVYDSTGRAGYDLESQNQDEKQDFNTLEEYLQRPDWYSAPRRVKLGAEISW